MSVFKNKPIIIAEIGMNHEGDFEKCKEILYQALETDVEIIKFQTFNVNGLVNKKYSPHRHEHFKKFFLPINKYKELAEICKKNGKIFMTSFWDIESIDILDEFVPMYKIGSGDLTNFQIIKKLALKNKPIIISTAMSKLDEVKKTIDYIEKINPKLIEEKKVAILHCVAMYGDPQNKYANLLSIKTLQKEFNLPIGYSDHTIGSYACELALGMGACVIEVHFSDNNKDREFRDHEISLTKNELQYLMEKRNLIYELLGKEGKNPIKPIENKDRIKQFRRALYFNKDKKKGEIIKESDLIALRPNTGIDATMLDEIIGKKINKDIKKLESLNMNYFY